MHRREKVITLVGRQGTPESIHYLRKCLLSAQAEITGDFKGDITNLLRRQMARSTYHDDLKFLKIMYEQRFHFAAPSSDFNWFNDPELSDSTVSGTYRDPIRIRSRTHNL